MKVVPLISFMSFVGLTFYKHLTNKRHKKNEMNYFLGLIANYTFLINDKQKSKPTIAQIKKTIPVF